MNVIKQCIKRPVAMLMAALAVLVFGAVSLMNTPITLIPEMNLPMMVVYTSYPNAGPSEVESLVTDPLESSLTSLSGVQSVDSLSSEGASIIMLTYNFGTDMTEPTAQIRDRLELVSAFLPEEASSPMLLKMNMDDTPVSYLSVTGQDIESAYTVAEDVFVPRLERVDGVASVDLSGGAEYSIVVELDEQAAERYGVTVSTLSSFISGSNISLPAGYLDQGSKSLFLRSENRITSAEEVANIPVTLPTGAVMRIADFATVTEQANEATSISRINGNPNLMISVSKQQDANTLRVCSDIADAVQELQALGYDIEIQVITDQGEFISDAMMNVLLALLAGAALAVLVLWFFLGDWIQALVLA